MNEIGVGPSTFVFAGSRLSWIRDTAAASVQSSWNASFRDVVILDPLNNSLEVFNLYLYPLAKTNSTAQNNANKSALKVKLVAAATPADTDNDRLPDYWEKSAYNNLARTGDSIGTDGRKALLHWAHGSSAPATGLANGLPLMVFIPYDGSLSMVYTRRRGTAFGLTVTPEFSTSLTSWTTAGHEYEEWSVRTLYDGSGGELVQWRTAAPGSFRFARTKAALP